MITILAVYDGTDNMKSKGMEGKILYGFKDSVSGKMYASGETLVLRSRAGNYYIKWQYETSEYKGKQQSNFSLSKEGSNVLVTKAIQFIRDNGHNLNVLNVLEQIQNRPANNNQGGYGNQQQQNTQQNNFQDANETGETLEDVFNS